MSEKVTTLRMYQSNLEVFTEDKEGESRCHDICLDGVKGELTREEWKEYLCDYYPFDEEGVNEILDELDTYEYFCE